MRHLTYFLPSAVLQAPHSPPLPACFDLYSRRNWTQVAFQNELRRIPVTAFRTVDDVLMSRSFFLSGPLGPQISMMDFLLLGGLMEAWTTNPPPMHRNQEG